VADFPLSSERARIRKKILLFPTNEEQNPFIQVFQNQAPTGHDSQRLSGACWSLGSGVAQNERKTFLQRRRCRMRLVEDA
jgi:hypothetical protein